jgi:hypothetical protein
MHASFDNDNLRTTKMNIIHRRVTLWKEAENSGSRDRTGPKPLINDREEPDGEVLYLSSISGNDLSAWCSS